MNEAKKIASLQRKKKKKWCRQANHLRGSPKKRSDVMLSLRISSEPMSAYGWLLRFNGHNMFMYSFEYTVVQWRSYG